MNILFQSDEDRIASHYFSEINDLIGFTALGLSYTALQFEHPIPFALIAFISAFFYAFSKGKEYKKIVRHYLPKGTHTIVYLQIFWQLRMFLFGMAFLFSIVLGFITKSGIYNLFGYVGA